MLEHMQMRIIHVHLLMHKQQKKKGFRIYFTNSYYETRVKYEKINSFRKKKKKLYNCPLLKL